MSLESDVCRLLLDIKGVSQNSITANLLAAKSVGELNVDDATLRAVAAITEKTLGVTFDAGITQVSLLLKDR
tara:strand:- start:1005 stop:1220 length:216 start_codon:yes stop_codon:yes gene_type:complete